MFAMLMTKADHREAGKLGLALVALEDWLCKRQQYPSNSNGENTVRKLNTAFINHQAKLWTIIVAVVGLIVLNVAAQRFSQPVPWEYKTMQFGVASGDNTGRVEIEFAEKLNRESAAGWEYAGRCGHVSTDDTWIDFVVFRRPRR